LENKRLPSLILHLPCTTALDRAIEIFVAIRGRYVLHESRDNIKKEISKRKEEREKRKKKRQVMYITTFVTNGKYRDGT
jgi:hypothetical protein